MIANNLTPYRFTHPGEIIKDELEDRGISQREFAQNVGMSYSVLNELLNAHRPLPPTLRCFLRRLSACPLSC